MTDENVKKYRLKKRKKVSDHNNKEREGILFEDTTSQSYHFKIMSHTGIQKLSVPCIHLHQKTKAKLKQKILVYLTYTYIVCTTVIRPSDNFAGYFFYFFPPLPPPQIKARRKKGRTELKEKFTLPDKQIHLQRNSSSDGSTVFRSVQLKFKRTVQKTPVYAS